MSVPSSVLSSNAFHFALTFLLGATLPLLVPTRLTVFTVGAVLVAGISVSFFFLLGEVYLYSDYYRRAFFVLGDDITTVLAFVFLYALAATSRLVMWLALVGVLMSGGKAAIVLMSIMVIALVMVQLPVAEWLATAKKVLLVLCLSVATCVALQVSSLKVMETPEFSFVRGKVADSMMELGVLDTANYRRRSSCADAERCLKTQIASPLSQRFYTQVAGLWMTLQGGFPGERYPSTPDEFADLMVSANPWGINDRYGLTQADWKRMGGVQGSYLRFGSGYGPWILLALIGVFAGIGYLAWSNLRHGESDTAAAFSIFFLVTAIGNWTQSWLTSWSPILVLMGMCSAQILLAWLDRRGVRLLGVPFPRSR